MYTLVYLPLLVKELIQTIDLQSQEKEPTGCVLDTRMHKMVLPKLFLTRNTIRIYSEIWIVTTLFLPMLPVDLIIDPRLTRGDANSVHPHGNVDNAEVVRIDYMEKGGFFSSNLCKECRTRFR